MVTGLTLLVIAAMLFIVVCVLYLDNKREPIGYLLFIAAFLAVVGSAIIDERLALDCVQGVETIEGDL